MKANEYNPSLPLACTGDEFLLALCFGLADPWREDHFKVIDFTVFPDGVFNDYGMEIVAEAVEELERLWSAQTVDQVFRVDSRSLFSPLLRWGIQLVSGGAPISPHVQGLLDTAPLRMFLNRTLHPAETGEIKGLARNIEAGRLRALAVATRLRTGDR